MAIPSDQIPPNGWKSGQTIECSECLGEGVLGDPDYSDWQCPVCHGTGYVTEIEPLTHPESKNNESQILCREHYSL
jgi:DnaJ-class molecular chaperone